ncbi:MAG: hypothetical protein MUO33_06620, partial [Sedimentisphaerales bacterium]|nr:hypothetical protein [Sedimentisphaerales bacterium]
MSNLTVQGSALYLGGRRYWAFPRCSMPDQDGGSRIVETWRQGPAQTEGSRDHGAAARLWMRTSSSKPDQKLPGLRLPSAPMYKPPVEPAKPDCVSLATS